MAIQSMAGIINQIQFQARQASGLNNIGLKDETGPGSSPFSALLASSISNLNQSQNIAKSQAQQFMSGTSDIGLNDVMVSLQKSSLMLNMGIQVRNKVVNAYQEVMGMSL